MRLVVAAHWVEADKVTDHYLDSLGHTLQGFKAPGTTGAMICYAEGDEQAQTTYDAINQAVEDRKSGHYRDLRPRSER